MQKLNIERVELISTKLKEEHENVSYFDPSFNPNLYTDILQNLINAIGQLWYKDDPTVELGKMVWSYELDRPEDKAVRKKLMTILFDLHRKIDTMNKQKMGTVNE